MNDLTKIDKSLKIAKFAGYNIALNAFKYPNEIGYLCPVIINYLAYDGLMDVVDSINISETNNSSIEINSLGIIAYSNDLQSHFVRNDYKNLADCLFDAVYWVVEILEGCG